MHMIRTSILGCVAAAGLGLYATPCEAGLGLLHTPYARMLHENAVVENQFWAGRCEYAGGGAKQGGICMQHVRREDDRLC